MGDSGAEIVRVGSADMTPSRTLLTRRGFIKAALTMAGMSLLSPWLTACGAGDTDLTPVQVQGTAQAALPEGERIEDRVPRWLKRRIGSLTINEQTNSGRGLSDFGTINKFFETDSLVALITAEHIGATFLWKDLTMYFPYGGQNRFINVDARLNAKNWVTATPQEWSIVGITPHSNVEKGILNPIRLIVVQKPLSLVGQFEDPVDKNLLQAYPGIPKVGETCYMLGFSGDNQGGLTGSELVFKRETKANEVGYAGIPLWQFDGPTGPQFSGSLVMSQDNLVVGMLSGGSQDQKTALVIPFNQYQPIAAINEILTQQK